MRSQQHLFHRFIDQLTPGQVEWIGLRPGRREPVNSVVEAYAIADLGLEGDRRCQATPGSARQVTIISAEHIGVIASLMQRQTLEPALLRRNIVIRGLNVQALRHQQFQIGEAVFLATAQCHPCSRMEEVLGPGGAASMLGHGGLCAKILRSGRFQIGDAVTPLSQDQWLPE